MLVYFMAIWYNLWPFGVVCGHLLYFSQFGIFGSRKIWQSCSSVLHFIGLFFFVVTQQMQMRAHEMASDFSVAP
jgi:hypothetical protein